MAAKLLITINREYGSGGRLIGKALSEKLGIPYYDDDIIKMASEYSAVGEQYFRMNDERPGNNLLKKIIGNIKNSWDKPSLDEKITSPDNLFKFESEVIRKISDEESCIFIGRCSDFVLSSFGNDDFISLFVYSDLPTKVRRVMDVDGVDTKEALTRVQKINKQRRAYYKYYTGDEWDDMRHYDLPINTSKIDIETACQLIINYLKLRGYNVEEISKK